MVGTTQINSPKLPLKRDRKYQKRKKRRHSVRIAAIKPIKNILKQTVERLETS